MKWQSKCQAPLLPLAFTSLILAAPAWAADGPMQNREQELRQRLAQSDVHLAALQQRIEQLERRLEALNSAMKTPASTAVQQRVAQASPPAPSSPSPAVPDKPRAATATSAPGAFEVDEEAAQRALERTLTRTGALLLPAGTIELAPRFSYTRSEHTSPIFSVVTDPRTSTPGLVLARQELRRNEINGSLGLKIGLPLESELEAVMPYNQVRSSEVDDFRSSSSARASGWGDLTVALAKTLVREKGWRPDLVGRVTYNSGRGRRQDGIAGFNSGYRQAQAEIVALKRQDPLAFTASVAYTKVYQEASVKPGDAASLSFGTTLAASPETSLQLGFSQIYRKEQELNGLRTRGSDQTYGIVTLGAASVLSRDVALLTQVGVGVGNDAPKYSFSFTLPILFH
ncbi:MAG: hypothetical protein V7606_2827 [Burkholderiales bacterium]|jgi:hypothetical protein